MLKNKPLSEVSMRNLRVDYLTINLYGTKKDYPIDGKGKKQTGIC